jgi:hypothetical protein
MKEKKFKKLVEKTLHVLEGYEVDKNGNKKMHIVGVEKLYKKLNLTNSGGSSIPKTPKPPLSRVVREGVGHFCTNCGSTMTRSGFLMLFGKRYCDNDKCPNATN